MTNGVFVYFQLKTCGNLIHISGIWRVMPIFLLDESKNLVSCLQHGGELKPLEVGENKIFSFCFVKLLCVPYCRLLGGDAGRAGAVEVNVLPLAVAAVPHTGLLRLHGAGHACSIHVLGQSNVSNTRCIFPDKVHVWIQ